MKARACLARNCRATPELAARHDPSRKEFWQVFGKTKSGSKFPITGVATNECPVTFITPQSKQLVLEHERRQMLMECGVAPTPASQLSIPLADALVILTGEQAKYDNLAVAKMAEEARREQPH